MNENTRWVSSAKNQPSIKHPHSHYRHFVAGSCGMALEETFCFIELAWQ